MQSVVKQCMMRCCQSSGLCLPALPHRHRNKREKADYSAPVSFVSKGVAGGADKKAAAKEEVGVVCERKAV